MGLLQNLVLRIKADPTNAVQGFNKVENQAKKMGRSVKQEVSNPLADAFKHITGNVRSFVLGLIAVEKAIETIKRLIDRGRSTQEIANRYRISVDQAALINRGASQLGVSADEIAKSFGLEEKPLTNKELRILMTELSRQFPHSIAAESSLAKSTLSTDNLGRKALELASKDTLANDASVGVAGNVNSSPFSQINNMGVFRKVSGNTVPADINQARRGLVRQGINDQMLRELQEINKNTEESARASKQEVAL